MDFNEKSKTWDSEYRVNRAKKISGEIRSYLNNEIKGLEFGCGTGLISFGLIDSFKEFMLIDLSEGMINVVNEKIKENNIDNMKTWCGDVLNLESDEKYDVIYTSMALHHIENLEETLSKLNSFLNISGKIIIVDLTKDDGSFHDKDFKGHHGFDIGEIKSILRKSGFDVLNDGRVFYSDFKDIEDKNHKYSLFSICGIKKEDCED